MSTNPNVNKKDLSNSSGNPSAGAASGSSTSATAAAGSGGGGSKEPPKITTVIATKGKGDDETEEISYTDAKVIGNGSFGVVYQARLIATSELVAIKKVLQDRRYKVRYQSIFLYISIHLIIDLDILGPTQTMTRPKSDKL